MKGGNVKLPATTVETAIRISRQLKEAGIIATERGKVLSAKHLCQFASQGCLEAARRLGVRCVFPLLSSALG
jgi:hypothetical protein